MKLLIMQDIMNTLYILFVLGLFVDAFNNFNFVAANYSKMSKQ
jgi:hypothetical protein